MKIFSGSKTPDFPTPPRIFTQDGSSSGGSSPTSRRSSFALAFSSSRLLSGSSSPIASPTLPQENSTIENLSPELIPIVTLLSAHAHRRYYEGVFLMLQDLKNDGSPGLRKWQEVYGLLVGTQLALWDANELASCNSNESRPKLKKVASKPRYVNFADAAVRLLDGSDEVITENNEKLQNTLVVSTTLKNRYFLQYSDKGAFVNWNAAIQLSLFECTSLQEAYTGAFLSSRGAQLGDIKTVLADSRFAYEDWVSVRFGTGMPWKRCYAVIYQPQSKKKKSALGHISFYENDKKTKKNNAIATIVTSKRLYAVYPSSPLLIDNSTIIKLEGTISFEKKDIPQDTNVFIMPEKHQAVPGYDTIIRFLVPAMNAFKLYGRPEKLIANKDDFRSLLFGLPALPHVHYLKVEELLPLTSSESSPTWTSHDWMNNIKEILQNKMSTGYSGCGSSAGVMGAMSSPVISSASFNDSSLSLLPNVKPEKVTKNRATLSSDSQLSLPRTRPNDTPSNSKSDLTETKSNSGMQLHQSKRSEGESVATVSVYSEQGDYPSKSPQQTVGKTSDRDGTGMQDPEPSPLKYDTLKTSDNLNPRRNPTTQSSSELDNIYHKYSLSPFGKASGTDVSPQISEHFFDNPYKRYNNDNNVNVPNIRQTTTDTINEENEGPFELTTEVDSIAEEQNALKEFNDLAKRINELDIGSTLESDRAVPKDKASPWDMGRVEATHGEDNVFDPDFMEQAQMLETESHHTGSESISDVSGEGAQTWQDSREGVNESLVHSDLNPVAQNRADRYQGVPNQGRRPPPRSVAQPANLNQYALPPASFPATPEGYMQAPGKYPQQGHIPPAQPMMSPGGFPLNNNPRLGPHPYNPHPSRPYPPGPSQQYFAKNGASYPRYYNGPPSHQKIPPGGVIPRQQMYQQGGRAGPYLPPVQPMSKSKSPTSNGFANFMPSTTVNPYAQ